MKTPQINVTPLIDVLLVLLIIFMVVSPLKPSAFKARIPSEPTERATVNDKALVVSVGNDGHLTLNNENAGSIGDGELSSRLKQVFADRAANGVISDAFADDPQRPVPDRIERTVFVKAPKTLDYGSVSRVVDQVNLAGAYPISLQIDALD